MKWITDGWTWIRSLGRRHAPECGPDQRIRIDLDVDRRLDEEIRFHLDQLTEKLRRAGMSPDEARRQALLTLGGVEFAKERTRDVIRSTGARSRPCSRASAPINRPVSVPAPF